MGSTGIGMVVVLVFQVKSILAGHVSALGVISVNPFSQFEEPTKRSQRFLVDASLQ